MSWQPIETAPKDVYILLYDSRYKHSEASYLIAKDLGGKWWGRRTISGRAHVWPDATHWMPLPEPPRLPVDEEADK